MKNFTFVAWCEFGKCDSGESYVDVELTDEEAERLIHYGTQSDVYYGGFSSCEELTDIYNKVYDAAIIQITDELIEFGLVDEDDEDYSEDWQADETYSCGVNFPTEFEDMLVDEE